MGLYYLFTDISPFVNIRAKTHTIDMAALLSMLHSGILKDALKNAPAINKISVINSDTDK